MSIRTNINTVRNGITHAMSHVDESMRSAAREMSMAVVQLAKEEIKGKRTKYSDGTWEKAIPGHPPMNRTGTLRRSIHASSAVRVGFASYKAVAGPSVIYGRALEVANQYAPPSWRGQAAGEKGFPYMSRALERLEPMISVILRKHLAGVR